MTQRNPLRLVNSHLCALCGRAGFPTRRKMAADKNVRPPRGEGLEGGWNDWNNWNDWNFIFEPEHA
jgi:hypothetical protein